MGQVTKVSSDDDDEYARWAREKNRGLPPMPLDALERAAQTYEDDFPVKIPAGSGGHQRCGSGHRPQPPTPE